MDYELGKLHEAISHCERCSQLTTKVPLLFMPNTEVKIMVVTQGPKGKVSRSDFDDVKKRILSPANFFMYPFLYTMFNGRFRPDGAIDKEPSTVYWTHMRKCFMEGKEGNMPDTCSGREDSYLRKEMRIVNPKLTIAVGKWAAGFFAEYDDRLKTELEKGLCEAFLQQKERFYRMNDSELGVDAEIAILPHPSGINASLWKELGENRHACTTVAILDDLRRKIADILGDGESTL